MVLQTGFNRHTGLLATLCLTMLGYVEGQGLWGLNPLNQRNNLMNLGGLTIAAGLKQDTDSGVNNLNNRNKEEILIQGQQVLGRLQELNRQKDLMNKNANDKPVQWNNDNGPQINNYYIRPQVNNDKRTQITKGVIESQTSNKMPQTKFDANVENKLLKHIRTRKFFVQMQPVVPKTEHRREVESIVYYIDI